MQLNMQKNHQKRLSSFGKTIKFLLCASLCTALFSSISLAQVPDIAQAQADSTNSTIPVYNYWQGESSEARKPFESALVKLVFKLSEDKYGPAEVNIVQWKITTKRSVQMLKEGEHLHLQNGPFLIQNIDPSAVIILPYNILNNLLGYRSLIVRKEEKDAFEKINTLAEFKQKVAGQGSGWSDIFVYQNNQVNVVEAPNFKGMFPMLGHKRFDYIPLGVIESESALENNPVKNTELAIVDNLIVFYPWPVNFIISKKFPELAERISYGMEKAISTGKYEELFQRYFGQELEKFKGKKIKVVYLSTPGIEAVSHTAPSLIMDAVFLQ